jgi:hypothetical protein
MGLSIVIPIYVTTKSVWKSMAYVTVSVDELVLCAPLCPRGSAFNILQPRTNFACTTFWMSGGPLCKSPCHCYTPPFEYHCVALFYHACHLTLLCASVRGRLELVPTAVRSSPVHVSCSYVPNFDAADVQVVQRVYFPTCLLADATA